MATYRPNIPEFPPGYFESKTDLILNLLKCYLPNFIIYPQVIFKNQLAHILWKFSLKTPDGHRGFCSASYWLISKRLEFSYATNRERVEIDTLHLDADL